MLGYELWIVHRGGGAKMITKPNFSVKDWNIFFIEISFISWR
jgi:hypothetical protein